MEPRTGYYAHTREWKNDGCHLCLCSMDAKNRLLPPHAGMEEWWLSPLIGSMDDKNRLFPNGCQKLVIAPTHGNGRMMAAPLLGSLMEPRTSYFPHTQEWKNDGCRLCLAQWMQEPVIAHTRGKGRMIAAASAWLNGCQEPVISPSRRNGRMIAATSAWLYKCQEPVISSTPGNGRIMAAASAWLNSGCQEPVIAPTCGNGRMMAVASTWLNGLQEAPPPPPMREWKNDGCRLCLAPEPVFLNV